MATAKKHDGLSWSGTTPFMSTKQAGEYLLLSPKTLEKMRWQGKGPYFRKHGSTVAYHVSDLEIWSSNNRHISTSD